MSELAVEMPLVEDTPTEAELVLHVLDKENPGGRIAVARDGEEALAFLFGAGTRAGRPAPSDLKLILPDLKLPGMDGLEVLRQVKADPRARTIPATVFSSSSVARDVAESYSLGANSYVVKPVGFQKFSAAVLELTRYWLKLNKQAAPPE